MVTNYIGCGGGGESCLGLDKTLNREVKMEKPKRPPHWVKFVESTPELAVTCSEVGLQGGI